MSNRFYAILANSLVVALTNTTGAGVVMIGGWFETGADRGIALLFTVTGLIGLIVTLTAMRSRQYQKLSVTYQKYLLPVDQKQ
jgi:cytochrome c biogenesis factor